MECPVCIRSYNLETRVPLVLKCGHSLCKDCVQQLGSTVKCPIDRLVDDRPVSDLPTNYALVDATHLQLTSAFRGLLPSSSSSDTGPAIARLYLDENELSLSPTVIGNGASGQVVEGTYEGQKVAVKVVDLTDASAATRQALQQEAQVLMALAGQCRHTALYKGATIKGNKFCLVMKRYSSSLAHVMVECGPPPSGLPLPRLQRYAAQILAALHELHSQEVCGADLRPQHLLLDDLDELVLSDMGHSRMVGRPASSSGAVRIRQGCFLNYMPPEQHQLENSVSPPAPTPAGDMWSWACLVIHMATCTAPLAELRPGQIIRHVGVHKRAPAIPETLPEHLRQPLGRCLAADSQQRPTALQALQELRKVSLQELSLADDSAAAPSPTTTPAEGPATPAQLNELSTHLAQLVQQMGSNDPEDQIAAAYELAYIAQAKHSTDTAIADVAATPGCLSGLMALLSSSSAEVQVQGVCALTSLACSCPADSAAGQAGMEALLGCMDRLMALLRSESTRQQASPVLDSLVCTLMNGSSNSNGAYERASIALCQRASEACETPDSLAALPCCMDVLIKLLSSSSEDVQQQAASALRSLGCNIAEDHEAMAAMPGYLDRLLALVDSSSGEVQASAADVLSHILYKVLRRTVFGEPVEDLPGCLQKLVVLLNSSNRSVVDQAVGTLSSLAKNGGRIMREAIVAAPGCLDRLVVLIDNSYSSGLAWVAAEILGHLASYSAANQAAIIAVPGCLDKLVGLLGSSARGGVQQQVAHVLDNLTSGDARAISQAAIIAVPGCLERLVSLLRTAGSSSVEDVSEQAATVLNGLAWDNAANSEAIVAMPGCLDSLVALTCSSQASGAAKRAGGVLESLASSSAANRTTIAAVPGCLDKLAALLHNPDQQTQAATVLAYLALDNAANQAAIAALPGCFVDLMSMVGGGCDAAAFALASLACGNAANTATIAAMPGCKTALLPLLENMPAHSSVEKVQACASHALVELQRVGATLP